VRQLEPDPLRPFQAPHPFVSGVIFLHRPWSWVERWGWGGLQLLRASRWLLRPLWPRQSTIHDSSDDLPSTQSSDHFLPSWTSLKVSRGFIMIEGPNNFPLSYVKLVGGGPCANGRWPAAILSSILRRM
jgi:hypothetical protein